MSSPCHVELILAEKEAAVKAEKVRGGVGGGQQYASSRDNALGTAVLQSCYRDLGKEAAGI
jgi:hypothetical protein